ncbi:MAG: haloacid dehalogenase type II [Hansschlegelia sp.]
MGEAALYVFDAYGTLFDVHSAVARHREAIGPQSERLSELWRTKQLEYAWVRSLMGAHRDFWSLTGDALDFAAARIGGVSAGTRALLLEAYRALDAYPEARSVLTMLRERGAKTAILSNGSQEMLDAAVSSAGLSGLLDAALSVEDVRVFKTDPRTYDMVCRRFDADRRSVSFQSSNRWDIAGARRFGFRTAWINRTGVPDEYLDLPPDRVLSDLTGLL